MTPYDDQRFQVHRTFAGSLSEVHAARQFAGEAVAEWGLDPYDTVMVVGELCANAVLHGRSSFTVEVAEADGRIRIAVADENPRIPSKAKVPWDARSGRGLCIVEGLSRQWGVDPVEGHGKVVWAECDAHQSPEPGPRDMSLSGSGPAGSGHTHGP
jgi:anti-sigma regulatory factor (Ser/Thr protein kinase)